jgi:hypothetical protein
MINEDNPVPENKLVYINSDPEYSEEKQPIDSMIISPPIKRDWFDSYWYHCLPITFANQYGYALVVNKDVEFFLKDELGLVDIKKDSDDIYPKVRRGPGYGLITIDFPFSIRTSPKNNILITNPFNHFMENLFTVTAIFESDNLRKHLNVGLKVLKPGVAKINKGDIIATLFPVQKYFVEGFELISGEKIFSEEDLLDEENAMYDFKLRKEYRENFLKNTFDKNYFNGYDLYGNKFKNHQKKYKNNT